MRRLKSTEGLTGGRGMTEKQRLSWLLSMPSCVEVANTVQELRGKQYNQGDGLVDTRRQGAKGI